MFSATDSNPVCLSSVNTEYPLFLPLLNGFALIEALLDLRLSDLLFSSPSSSWNDILDFTLLWTELGFKLRPCLLDDLFDL